MTKSEVWERFKQLMGDNLNNYFDGFKKFIGEQVEKQYNITANNYEYEEQDEKFIFKFAKDVFTVYWADRMEHIGEISLNFEKIKDELYETKSSDIFVDGEIDVDFLDGEIKDLILDQCNDIQNYITNFYNVYFDWHIEQINSNLEEIGIDFDYSYELIWKIVDHDFNQWICGHVQDVVDRNGWYRDIEDSDKQTIYMDYKENGIEFDFSLSEPEEIFKYTDVFTQADLDKLREQLTEDEED